jgi:type I restriction enzyme R subunit
MQVKEVDIERNFIQKLEYMKYTWRPDIRDKATLKVNFREKFEALNHVKLTDSEFARLHDSIINADVFQASLALREQGYFQREDGTPLHYTLVNLKNWCKNDFEVVNQLRINTDNSNQRYDVIILINGLPLVQVELKTLGISPRRAMEQIVRYKNDPGNGYTNSLMCFMQLFIVSSRDKTYYFANNPAKHFTFDADERYLPIYQLADEKNRKITHLDEFAGKFLHKCTLAQLISRYMVLVQSEQRMLIMRPYQIYAVKAIVDCIHDNRGNGYIWHTTGSGKTLTSFKASTLLKDNPDIEKCLFVVDRKDLDRQTREEFNKFQPGCVEENTNTATLVKRLLSTDYADKVIVTTIQKLGLALDETNKKARQQQNSGRATWKQRLAPLRDKRMVFIFDECHRSQFGDNHQAIKDFFPKAQLFGFTGTPIFEQNASYKQFVQDGADTIGSYKTTQEVFQKQLHAYTITHAIDDGNVLRFHVDYFKSDTDDSDRTEGKAKTKPDAETTRHAIATAILAKHDTATNGRRFNALFATGSINEAIAYYELFKTLRAERAAAEADYQPLNIACVFSPPADGNKDVRQLQEDLPQEKADNRHEPGKKKAALKTIIDDYNAQYGTNHRLAEFDAYYQDVQDRIKDQKYPNADLSHAEKIDITIVVDMLLTGFDSKYLNTLYVDKNLKHHGLIQAFSRTNRVLNDTKPYGNVLDFRSQKTEVDKAIALFSGEDNADAAREIWLVEPAPEVIKKLDAAVTELETFMDAQGLPCQPEEVANLRGDIARAEFVSRFKEVQRLKTRLDQYTDLDDEQKQAVEKRLPQDTLRAFKGQYLDTAQQLKAKQGQHGQRSEGEQDAIDQLDFEFVLFSSATIDYDYIMALMARFSEAKPSRETMTRAQLKSMLGSTSNLVDDKADLDAYIDTLQPGAGLSEAEIRKGFATFKADKAKQAVAGIAQKHGLASERLHAFVDGILARMIFDGEALSDLMAPLELGWKARSQAELALMADLAPLLRKQAQGREISGLSAYE